MCACSPAHRSPLFPSASSVVVRGLHALRGIDDLQRESVSHRADGTARSRRNLVLHRLLRPRATAARTKGEKTPADKGLAKQRGRKFSETRVHCRKPTLTRT